MALIAYLLLLHLLLGILLSGRGRRFVPALQSRDQELKREHFRSQMLTFHRRIDEMAEPGSVLFIGASGIQGMDVDQICEGALNFGIGGDTTEGVLQRLPTYFSLKSARAVVLSIGFNDLGISSDAEIIAHYQKILEAIPEHMPLLVCSLVEVNEEIVGPGINKRVNRLNPILANLCVRRERTKFLDLNMALLVKFKSSHACYLESDGCHLNPEGRQTWVENVRNLLAADFSSNSEISD